VPCHHEDVWKIGGIDLRFLTVAVSGELHSPAALFPAKGPSKPNVKETGWSPEPVAATVREVPGSEPRSVGCPACSFTVPAELAEISSVICTVISLPFPLSWLGVCYGNFMLNTT
jgi:hypothetical protein